MATIYYGPVPQTDYKVFETLDTDTKLIDTVEFPSLESALKFCIQQKRFYKNSAANDVCTDDFILPCYHVEVLNGTT